MWNDDAQFGEPPCRQSFGPVVVFAFEFPSFFREVVSFPFSQLTYHAEGSFGLVEYPQEVPADGDRSPRSVEQEESEVRRRGNVGLTTSKSGWVRVKGASLGRQVGMDLATSSVADLRLRQIAGVFVVCVRRELLVCLLSRRFRPDAAYLPEAPVVVKLFDGDCLRAELLISPGVFPGGWQMKCGVRR